MSLQKVSLGFQLRTYCTDKESSGDPPSRHTAPPDDDELDGWEVGFCARNSCSQVMSLLLTAV